MATLSFALALRRAERLDAARGPAPRGAHRDAARRDEPDRRGTCLQRRLAPRRGHGLRDDDREGQPRHRRLLQLAWLLHPRRAGDAHRGAGQRARPLGLGARRLRAALPTGAGRHQPHLHRRPPARVGRSVALLRDELGRPGLPVPAGDGLPALPRDGGRDPHRPVAASRSPISPAGASAVRACCCALRIRLPGVALEEVEPAAHATPAQRAGAGADLRGHDRGDGGQPPADAVDDAGEPAAARRAPPLHGSRPARSSPACCWWRG